MEDQVPCSTETLKEKGDLHADKDFDKTLWLIRLIRPKNTSTEQLKICIPLFLSTFGTTLVFTMAFPYLPRMTMDFGFDEVDIGKYAGIVASSLHVGAAFASYIWGTFADRFGRRKTILLSSSLVAVFTFLFGFNFSFLWVTFTRMMQGVTTGVIVGAKAAIVDISDDSNQGILMGILMSAFALGYVVGPSIGGLLALPHEKYPSVFAKDNLFGLYPYLLPNFIAVLIILLGIVFTYFLLPETLKRKKVGSSEKEQLLNGQSIPSYNKSVLVESGEETLPTTETANLHDSSNSLINDDYTQLPELHANGSIKKQKTDYISRNSFSLSGCADVEQRPQISFRLKNFCHNCLPFSCCQDNKKPSTLLQLLKISEVRLSVFLFGVYYAIVTAYEELFPLFAATYTRYHGLSFSTNDIGIVLLAQAGPNVITGFLIAPKLERKFGSIKMYALIIYVFAFMLPLIPCNSRVPRGGWLWSMLIIELIPLRIAMTSGFLCVNILVSNSVERHLQGVVNGLTMSVTSVFRAVSPAVVGSMYSWSLKHGNLGFPLNYNFPFLFLSLSCIMTLFFVIALPKSMNRKKESLLNID